MRICTPWGQPLSCLSYSICFTNAIMFWLQPEYAAKTLLPFQECSSREKALSGTANMPTDYSTRSNPDLPWNLCNCTDLTDIGSGGVCIQAHITIFISKQPSPYLAQVVGRNLPKCFNTQVATAHCKHASDKSVNQSFLFSIYHKSYVNWKQKWLKEKLMAPFYPAGRF